MITRIGIKANIKARISDTVSFKFAVLNGNNPFDKHTQRIVIDENRKKPPVNRFQPAFVHEITKEHLDTGKYVR